jgi:endonuclease YncB( thermonuclease family)
MKIMAIPAFPLPFGSLRLAVVALTLFVVNPSRAANTIVRDATTIQLGDITYRLDGIDAPDFDQMCVDDHADSWTCGVEARDQLARLIGTRAVHCDDLGPDKRYARRHLGLCTADGDETNLNQLMVRQGLALSFEPSARTRFDGDEAAARDGRKGLWRGCFVAPQEFRRSERNGKLLGAACRSDKDREIRQILFPEEPVAPPCCNIKAKFAARARVTGKIGVYHLQGCRSYAPLAKPDRWFCAEEDAQAAGFRKAYNCRAEIRRQ